MSRVYLLLHFN